MNASDILPLIASGAVLAEPISKLLSPFAAQVGETFADAWELAMGTNVKYFKEKNRLKRERSLLLFEQKLAYEIKQIPPEKVVEPAFRIIGPALEASKYHYDEPSIRDMFAKLIASSMNSDYKNSIHPAFASIITQLSPLDAATLKYIVDEGRTPASEVRQIPAAVFSIKQKNGAKGMHEGVFIYRESVETKEQYASINSLTRNGLIRIEDAPEGRESIYAGFKEYKTFVSLSKANPEIYHLPQLQKKVLFLTGFGDSFCAVCLP